MKQYKFQPCVLQRLEPNNKNCQLPKGRSGHRIVSDNSYVYSFGGFNPFLDDDQHPNNDIFSEMKLFKELWRFNIACNEWEKLAHYTVSLPKELASNAVIMRGNTLIVHGGTGVPFGYNCSNKTYITNLKENKSLQLLETKGDHPPPQYGQAMVLDGQNLYVVGGTSGFEYSANIHCLDLKTKIWSPVYIKKGISLNEPLGRYRHEIAFYNSKIIIFGGGTVQNVFELQHLPAYNLVKNEWEVLTTKGDPNDDSTDNNHQGFPAPRRCHGSVQTQGDGQDPEFIICGGYNGEKIFSDIWTLNLRTLQWTKWKEELKYPLNFHSTSLSPCGKMFIFGGICEIFNEEQHVLTFRTNAIFSTWVKIPKLSEMCWEALLFYAPHLTSLPRSQLLSYGVPLQFVERMGDISSLKVYPTPEELSSVCSRVQCPQADCNALFQSTSNLNMHLIKHHKIINNGLTKKKDMQYFCPIKSCPYFKDSSKYFTKLKYLKQHFLKVHALKKYICTKCDKKFSTEAFKVSHMKNCGKLFICTCGSTYTSSEAILTHCRRKGDGHLFVAKSDKVVKNQCNNASQINEGNNKKLERFIYPKLSCDMSFPIHYIAAIALSELSTPCNLSKLVDKGIQTDTSDFSLKKSCRSNVETQKGDKKWKSSQHTQTATRIKKLKKSAETQTNGDYLKQKVKTNFKCLPRKRKKSMETQTREHLKGNNNMILESLEWNSKEQRRSADKICHEFLKTKDPDILSGTEQTTENATLEKEKNSNNFLWDNNYFYQKDSSNGCRGSEVKNELLTLSRDLNLCTKELNLNEYNHLPQKGTSTHYTSEQGPDSQIFDLNKLCNIETQTEIDAFLTECDDETPFTLCSSTAETQTTNDLDSLLYSNMCTQTCEEVDELFNFNFVHIETQTTWPDLADSLSSVFATPSLLNAFEK
ncbi:hypothetical protein RUM43_000754 [Polyplax serrata]|uniref:C2H2-type domain-containing protein n=1 Tax=Polyplax serrata TaxID=468196 RepID=A0AAN8XSS2_POLSC